jgi:4-amino-4-deoxy-L-arabinose transferase-like glycosyltransferase
VPGTPPPDRTSPELRRLLVLVVVVALVRLATLGMYPLMDSTEARYAEIARRMAELGDWVTPWIGDGVPFWGKPPLSFWMTASSFELFGPNGFAARLPHWLCAVAVGWLVWSWMERRSRREAVYALALTATSALFFASAGSVMTDMALALGLTMAMRGFWLALHETGRLRLREETFFFLGIAIGLLAKGPLMLVLAGAPVAAWSVATGNVRRVLGTMHWIVGLAAVLALVAPWYALAESRTPGFLAYFIVGEHWQRFMVAGWSGDLYGHAHAFPRGTIWLFALLALMPWTLLLPAAAWRWRRHVLAAKPEDRPLASYLCCWALAPCVAFTMSGNILWTYVLPAIPAFAMLVAMHLRRLPRGPVDGRWLPAGVATTAVVGFAIVVAFNAGGWDEVTSARTLVQQYESRRSEGEALVFFRKQPLSGSFYSAGQAEQVMTVEELHARLARGPAYVAVKDRHAERVPDGLRDGLRLVARSGKYELLYSGPGTRQALAPGHPPQ